MMVAIVGPTGSGKSDLALSLAKRFDGEIICADSQTIYRDMDIGTAKPSTFDQAVIAHHLIDVRDPGQVMTAVAFKHLATSAATDIVSRAHLPFLVGGSGLYVDSVLYDYQFPPEPEPDLRKNLMAMGDESLRSLLVENDAVRALNTDLSNRRRVIRAIETAGEPRLRSEHVIPNTLVLGMTMSKELAQEKIRERVKLMLDKGFIKEVERIGTKYGWDSAAFKVIGYRAFKDVILGSKSIHQGIDDFVRADIALYKKQLTWFKRNKEIQWLAAAGAAETYRQAEQRVATFIDTPESKNRL